MKKLKGIVAVDRYGGKYPDPATMCLGPCEGMGVYPENDKFVKCKDCGGTGKRKTSKAPKPPKAPKRSEWLF